MEKENIMNHIIRDMNEWMEKIESPSNQDNVVHIDPQPIIPDIDTLIMHHRSRRVIRSPVMLTLMGKSSLIVLESHEGDPTYYYKTINEKDSNFRKEAMKSELESMYSNNVWTLVDLPQGVKPIGCKCVYKRKRVVDGKIETYKARLVEKAYNKKFGFDYEENFLPMAMI